MLALHILRIQALSGGPTAGLNLPAWSTLSLLTSLTALGIWSIGSPPEGATKHTAIVGSVTGSEPRVILVEPGPVHQFISAPM
jgi:hypothetical protein